MRNLRVHGEPPYRLAVLHGGPGAAGEVEPVARRLATYTGVLEPLQTGLSVKEQVEDLGKVLRSRAELPVMLVGYSWGAWLAYITAAQRPDLVSRLVLVSSGAFESRYASGLMATRLSRLSPGEREEAERLGAQLQHSGDSDQDDILARFGALMSRADTYDRVDEQPEPEVDVRLDIYRTVWPEADELRRSGQLLAMGRSISCPVVAIHGGYDPTPAEGVREPLSSVLRDFRFVLLDRCGHTPWVERHARERFYELLREEVILS